MAVGRAILKLTDGTDEIDLLGARFEFKSQVFLHEDWVAQVAEWKDGGTWSQSALSDGRRLRYRVFDNTIETIHFKATDRGQDELITSVEDLLAMLEKAADYWAAEWSTEPVYLVCRATEETNTRYALLHAGRVPELDDYYRQPFIQPDPSCDALMDRLTLVLERGHWQDTVPGEGNCLPISAVQASEQFFPLVFNGDTSSVDLGSPAALDDLPDFAVAGNGQIQVEAWVKADGWGEGNAGVIAEKSNNRTLGWWFDGQLALGGLGGAVRCAGGPGALTRIGTDDWSPDGEWHHLLFSYDETGTRLMYVAVDGVWVTTYTTQTASVGNYLADNGTNLHVGNLANGSAGFDGEIGWLRVWNTLHYTVGTDFDDALPPRCPIPSAVTGAGTAWLGIHEGTGTTIYDLSGNGNNGTAANTTWGDACAASFGNYADGAREETCDREVFVANKANLAQLTHVFYLDASGPAYSANLLTQALPYDLLPAAPANGDFCYFAVQSTGVNGGPFCSLVFDLATPAAINLTTVSWEYWNGAWVALTVQDSTASGGVPLTYIGVTSVHWNQPADWTTTTVNGVTGYFVRASVTAVGGAPTAPTQQNRNIYTVLWPYLEVQASQVGGTLTNVVRFVVQNESDVDLSTAPVLFSNRMVCGLRSYSRGADFNAYINLSDVQEPDGIAVTAPAASAAFANDITTPTGRKIQCTNVPAGDTLARVSFNGLTSTLAQQYTGTFHVFMRIDQTSGAAGDVDFQLQGQNGATGANSIDLSERVTPPSVNAWEVVDFGLVTIPFGVDAPASEIGTFYLNVYGRGDSSVDVDLFDLQVIPVDEWAVDTLDPNPGAPVVLALGARGWTLAEAQFYLDLDSITWPKRPIRSVLKASSNDTSVDGWRAIANGLAIAQANARQRYWFLHADTSSNPAIGSQPEVVTTVQAYNVQRYLGARGDR